MFWFVKTDSIIWFGSFVLVIINSTKFDCIVSIWNIKNVNRRRNYILLIWYLINYFFSERIYFLSFIRLKLINTRLYLCYHSKFKQWQQYRIISSQHNFHIQILTLLTLMSVHFVINGFLFINTIRIIFFRW